MTKLLDRTITKTIKNTARMFPCVLLTGSRQIGKTTLLKDLLGKKINYVSLDNLKNRQLAQNDPEMFLQTFTPPLIIDEVQYAPDLFIYIKIYVDSHSDENGLFLLTGSQKFTLMKNIRESLAGRIAIIDMLGLSGKEIEDKADYSIPFVLNDEWLKHTKKYEKIDKQKRTLADIYKKIFFGSYPRIVANNMYEERELFFKSYIQTYIERDVKDILSIKDNMLFFNFIQLMASRTGQLMNYNDVAKDLGINAKTVKEWISILETSNIVKLLYPYHSNLNSRIIKTPKIYFLDTGLISYLTNWSSPETLEAGAMSGVILETYVFAEILKSYWNNGKEANIYFYRDKDKTEIDFILEENNTLYPIEVKKNISPSSNVVKSFNVLKKLNKNIGYGSVICLKDMLFPVDRENYYVPVWDL